MCSWARYNLSPYVRTLHFFNSMSYLLLSFEIAIFALNGMSQINIHCQRIRNSYRNFASQISTKPTRKVQLEKEPTFLSCDLLVCFACTFHPFLHFLCLVCVVSSWEHLFLKIFDICDASKFWLLWSFDKDLRAIRNNLNIFFDKWSAFPSHQAQNRMKEWYFDLIDLIFYKFPKRFAVIRVVNDIWLLSHYDYGFFFALLSVHYIHDWCFPQFCYNFYTGGESDQNALNDECELLVAKT